MKKAWYNWTMRKNGMIKILGALLCLVLALLGMTQCASPTKETPVVTPSPTVSVTATPQEEVNTAFKQLFSATYAPLALDNTTGFASGWSGQTTDGALVLDNLYNTLQITVDSTGTARDSTIVYRDGVPLETGHTYSITCLASSSINRNFQIALEDANNSNPYAVNDFSLTTEVTPLSFTFTMNNDSNWNGRLALLLGNDGGVDSQTTHTITIQELRITDTTGVTGHDIRVNQVSYLTNNQKRCVFPYDAGDFFDVVDLSTQQVVYTGAIVGEMVDEATGETDFHGDFTNLTTPGAYYIRSQIGVASEPFTIGDASNYRGLLNSLQKMISLQRCGEALDASWAENFYHEICHNDLATLYGTEETLDVHGGWHDAGDYGRYVKTGTKAVTDLLFAYLRNPSLFSDDTGSNYSGDGQPDILQEARVELDWLLRMQASDGGVYAKVITQGIPDTILPEDDHQAMFVLPVKTTSTGDFAGTLALASIVYAPSDPDYAAQCLEAAKLSYTYLQSHPDFQDDPNPSDLVGGDYRDDSDKDERYFAAMALWAATQDDAYLQEAIQLYQEDAICATGTHWRDMGAYGTYLYLVYSTDTSSDFYNSAYHSLTTEADQMVTRASSSGYQVSLASYDWGSNGFAANAGIVLTMAADLTHNQVYEQAAQENLNYLLGKNSLNTSFVSGFGTTYPLHVHSRIAEVRQDSLFGALVGGPNSAREDDALAALPVDLPFAKTYTDSYLSYSSNEITIYWNAAIIHLLAALTN